MEDEAPKTRTGPDWLSKYYSNRFFRISRAIKNSLPTWERVRGFGELQALNRISYSVLFLVPILSAVWPVISRGLRYYEAFFQASGRLPLAAFDENQAHDMPTVWVLAFIAALCAVTAQTLYQIYAPEIVKSQTRDEYVQRQLEKYHGNPSWDNFSYYVGILCEMHDRNWKTFDDEVNGRVAAARIKELNEVCGYNISVKREGVVVPPKSQQPLPISERDKEGVVQRAISFVSEEWYLQMSRTLRAAAIVAGLLYQIAFLIVLWITYTQTANVLTQAGWL